MSLSILFDHAQKRLRYDRIGAAHCGMEFNGLNFSGTWIDPLTHTLMLRPAPLYPAWYSSNAGNYAKYAKSDYTLATSAKWVEEEVYSGAGKFLTSQDVTETVHTTAALAKNQPIWLSWFEFGSGDNFVQMECGWSNAYDGTAGVSLRFYTGGDVEVWKAGAIVGNGKVSGSTTAAAGQNSMTGVMLIPCRGRELLVWSTAGDGFSHVFDDVLETDADPTITAAERFWWKVPSGKAKVQCAKIKFPTSGYACTAEYVLAEAPQSTDAFELYDNDAWAGGSGKPYRLFGHSSFVGTVGGSVSMRTPANAAFVADGSSQNYLMRVDLTGDGTATPFVYGASLGWEAVAGTTSEGSGFYSPFTPGGGTTGGTTRMGAYAFAAWAFAARAFRGDGTAGVGSGTAAALARGGGSEVVDFVLAATLNVPDSPSGVSLDLTFRDPQALEDAGVSNFVTISNRPLLLSHAFGDILDGVTDPVEWTMAVTDEVERASVCVRDKWKALENYRFRDPLPLAGMNLVDAIKTLVKIPTGIEDSDFDCDAVDFELGAVPSKDSDEWPIVVEVGDTAAEWVQRLVEDYATGFYYGFKPTATGIKFVFKDPDLLPTSGVVMYSSRDAALAANVDELDVPRALFWRFHEKVLEPEANDVRVTGMDPRSGRAIQAYYPDYESQDPTTAVASRPSNWLGEIRHFGLVDGTITTQQLCNDAATAIFKKVSPIRRYAEWECDMQLNDDGSPVWRGDVLTLDGLGSYRIESLRCDFLMDVNDTDTWWPTTYTGVLVG